ncbi:MAG: PPC domain-containing protein [Myxococcales bacterium]|nr:PPC domain-containing protein [Myxococcales bacterium]
MFAKAIDVVDNVTNLVLLTNHNMNATSAWKSKYAAVTVEAGTKSLVVQTTGTGDAQLFVRRSQNPTVYTYDCKSDAVGSSNETCTLTNPAAGTYYVRIRTRTANTVVSVNAVVTR